MDSIPKGKRVDKTLLETLCRLICEINGGKPDLIVENSGMFLGKEINFPAWQLQTRLAQGIIAAGWKPSRRKKK